MLQWRTETPSLELNIQIVLSGFVFVILPLFLITALFKVSSRLEFHLFRKRKNFSRNPFITLFFSSFTLPLHPQIGNLANDGIKLGTSASTVRRCSADPHDGLEEESKGGTVRYFSIISHSLVSRRFTETSFLSPTQQTQGHLDTRRTQLRISAHCDGAVSAHSTTAARSPNDPDRIIAQR